MEAERSDEIYGATSLVKSKLDEAYDHYQGKYNLNRVRWAAQFYSNKGQMVVMNLLLIASAILSIYFGSAWIIGIPSIAFAAIYIVACMYKHRVTMAVTKSIQHVAIYGYQIPFNTAKYFLIRSNKYPKWLK